MKVIGMMSGTSLDGMDLCSVIFSENDKGYTYTIEYAKTYRYDTIWENDLKKAYSQTPKEVDRLNKKFTFYVNQKIKEFIEEFSIESIDLIASHGHTIWHKPNEGYTLQIGNLPNLKEGLPVPVVCDFRVQDVQFGGQGAPLVPIGDQLLFSNYDFCLNLGGFSNISFQKNGVRRAFDICPINILLNEYTLLYYQKPYDDQGKFASQGKVCSEFLDELNSLEFYNKNTPKSLGVEEVNAFYKPIVSKYVIEPQDLLCTLVEHMAIQIGKVVNQYQGETMLVTGGGAFNSYLIHRIKKYCKTIELIIPDTLTIEYKEALIFAFLGYLKIQDKINCLSSVTGAKKDHSSGVIYR